MKLRLIVLLLLVVNSVSAIAVVYSVFLHRQYFSKLDAAFTRSINLEEEWGRLLLEHSTWAAPDRIEKLAAKKLGMKMPEKDEIKIINN